MFHILHIRSHLLLLLIWNTVQYGEIAAGASAVVHDPLQYGWEQTPNAIYQLPPCYLSAFQLAIELYAEMGKWPLY